MKMNRKNMILLCGCMLGMASVLLQSCVEEEDSRYVLCGNWESVGNKPDVLIFKEGDTYKVTIFKRSAIRRKLKPETYLLMEDNGNVFFNTGFRIDVAYNEATDVLTFSPNGDYVRKAESPVNMVEEIPELEEDYNPGLTFEEMDAIMRNDKE